MLAYDLLCSDPRHPRVLHSGILPAGAVPHAESHVSAATRSHAGGTDEEVSRDHW